jgi:hypothetical protein
MDMPENVSPETRYTEVFMPAETGIPPGATMLAHPNPDDDERINSGFRPRSKWPT